MITLKSLRNLSIIAVIGVAGVVGFNKLNNINFNKEVLAHNAVLYPKLLNEIELAHSISIQKNNVAINISRDNNGWVMVEKANFPVEEHKVNDLLLELASIKIVEAKTQDINNFVKIGVADLDVEKSDSTLLTVNDINNKVLASIYIGNTNPTSLQDATVDHIFVRKNGEMQSYLVKGKLPVFTEFNEWVEQPLIKVDTFDLKKVIISQVSKDDEESTDKSSSIVLLKKDKDDKDFEIENIPEGKELSSNYAISSLSYTLAFMNFDDVAKATDIDGFNPDLNVDIKTFDDKEFKVAIGIINDKPYAKLVNVNNEDTPRANWLYQLADDVYATLSKPLSSYLIDKKTGVDED